MDGIHVAHLISFLCCVVFLAWFFRHMSCVPKGASISGLSVHDCPFGFSTVYKTKNVSSLPLSTMCRLDFGALPTVWYFLVLSFSFIEVLLSYLLGKRLSNYISVKPLRYD